MSFCAVTSVVSKDENFQRVKEYYNSRGKKYCDDHLANVLQMAREHYGYDADWYPVTSAQYGVLTRYMTYILPADELKKTTSTMEADDLYNLYATLHTAFSPEELSNRVNMIVNRFVKRVDSLVKSTKGTHSRQRVIKSCGDKETSGVTRILDDVFSFYEDYYSNIGARMDRWKTANPDATDEEIENRRQIFEEQKRKYDIVMTHKNRIAALAAARIGEIEGFVVNARNFEINFNEDTEASMESQDSDAADDNDGDAEENTKGERFDDYRTLKIMNTLSVEARRFVSGIPKLDSNGNPMFDDLGVQQYLEGRQVAVVLKRALVNSTPDTMMSDLETEAEFHPWMTGIIKRLEKDTDKQSLVYNNFKGSETTYVYSSIDRGGYRPHIANSRSAGFAMMREAGTNISSGLPLDERTTITTGNGALKSPEQIAEIAKELEELRERIQSKETGLGRVNMVETNADIDTTPMEEFLNENPDVLVKLASYLRSVGFNVTPKDIKTVALQTMTAKSYGFIASKYDIKKGVGRNKLYHLVNHLSSLYSSAQNQSHGITTGRSLYNTNSSTFRYINNILALSKYDEVESRVNVNGKSLSAHNNNNLIHQIFDMLSNKAQLSEEKYQEMLENEYLQYEGMSLGFGLKRQVHGWLRKLSINEDGMRDMFRVVDMAQVNGVEYDRLTSKQKLTNSLVMFLTGGNLYQNSAQYAAYEVPIQADYETAYQFVIAPHMTISEVEEELTNEVLIELERIASIRARKSNASRVELKVYEEQGGRIQIFPALNDTGFVEAYSEIEDPEAARQFVRDNIAEQLDSVIREDLKYIEKKGILSNKILSNVGNNGEYKGLYSEDGSISSLDDDAIDTLRWYAANVFYARQQITKLTVGGLEQFSGVIDYEKRNMLCHATRTSIYTNATWKGKPLEGRTAEQNVMYIDDDRARSAFINELVEMLQVLKDKKLITSKQFDYMSKTYENINTTDGQGLRTLDSYRKLMIMSSQWSDRLEAAYKRIKSGKPTRRDIQLFINNKKPVFSGYEHIAASAGENQKPVKLTVLHKYAEMVLLPLELAPFCVQANSTPFRALAAANEELKKSGNDVDMFIFNSGVKVGSHSVVSPFAKWKDIKGTNGKTDEEARKERGWDGQDINERVLFSEDEIRDFIVDSVKGNKNVIHKLQLKYYGISSSTPEHAADESIAWVSQAEKQVFANINSDDEVIVRGKKMKSTYARDTYFKIKAADILMIAEELRKTFLNSDELEKVFQEELANKSYTASDVKYALAHLKDGSFALPLYSPNVEHQVQQLLTSVIRKRITKPKKKGVAMLQTTSLGVDYESSNFDNNEALSDEEKLHAVFEGEGENRRLKYFEVFMPIHDSRLKKYADENGNIPPARLQELVDKKLIPESMLEFVAFRTPSDAEHSIIPCRIKGFTANVEGATIRISKEAMVMTGHDYDGDKIRCYFKEFVERDEIPGGPVSAMKAILGQEDILTGFDVYEYDYDKSPFENTQEARNNARVELMFAKASSSFGSKMMIIPGGCEETSILAKTLFIMRNSNGLLLNKRFVAAIMGDKLTESEAHKIIANDVLLYKTLMNKSDKEISKLVNIVTGNSSPFSVKHSNEAYESIMGGASMIGPYAVQSSAFQMFQRLNLVYNPKRTQKGKPYDVTILGCHFDRLFQQKNSAGLLGSFTLGHLVNAAVDNNKNPIIGYLNQTHENSALTFMLAAAGMKEEHIHLIMNQPAMLELVSRLKKQDSGSLEDEIYKLVEELVEDNAKLGEAFFFGENQQLSEWFAVKDISNLTEEDLINNLSKSFDDIVNGVDEDAIRYQADILGTMYHLAPVASLLSDFVTLTRPDADSRAMGTSVASVVLKSKELNDFREKLATDKNPRILGMSEAIAQREVYGGEDMDYALESMGTELPEVAAYNTAMMDNGPVMFSRFFPLANKTWSDFATFILDKYNGLFNSQKETILQHIGEEMILWRLLSDKRFVKGDPQEEQNRILVDVPKQLFDLKKRIADAEEKPGTDADAEKFISNAFLDKLTVWRPENENELPRVRFTMNGAPVEGQRDLISASWGAMLESQDSDIRQLAIDLFKYCLYTNGFSYGMYEFSHFAPFSVMYSTPGYIEALRDAKNKTNSWAPDKDGLISSDARSFMNYYYMNHWGDNRLVRRVNISSLAFEAEGDELHLTDATDPRLMFMIGMQRYLVVESYNEAGKKIQNLYRVLTKGDYPITLSPAPKLGKMSMNQQVTIQYNPAVDYTEAHSVVTGNDSAWGNLEELNYNARGRITAPGEHYDPAAYGNNAFGRLINTLKLGIESARLARVDAVAAAVSSKNDKVLKQSGINPFGLVGPATVSEAVVGSSDVYISGDNPFGLTAVSGADLSGAVVGSSETSTTVNNPFGLPAAQGVDLSSAVVDIGSENSPLSAENANDNKSEYYSIIKTDENGKITVNNVPITPNNTRLARKQKVFVELNKRLREILREKGIAVGVLTNAEARLSLGGITDFDTATVTAEGLKEMIRLANGYVGEVSLPEEFAHISLEMLGHDHPLVKRLLAVLSENENAMREAFGGMYGEYKRMYGENNTDKLVLEAAGKLVAKNLLRQQEIETSTIKRLVHRIVDAIKSLFRKFRFDEVQQAIFDANDIASKLAQGMLSGNLVEIMDLGNVRASGQMYKAQKDLSGKNDILSKLLQTEVKRLSILKKRAAHLNLKKDQKAVIDATEIQIRKLESAIMNYKTESAIVSYLSDSLEFLARVEQSLDDAVNSGRPMNSICRKLCVVRDTLYSFSATMEAISDAIVSKEINDTADITSSLDALAGVLSRFHNKYEILAKSYFETMLSNIYGSEGVTVDVGKYKGRHISIHEMASKADNEVSTAGRLFNAIADCGDYVLSAFDDMTSSAKLRARRRAAAIRPRLEVAMENLVSATGSRDQSFMFEKKLGTDGKMHKTGKYISQEEADRLPDAQRKFYSTIIEIKSEIDKYMPDSLIEDNQIIMVRKYTMDKFLAAEGVKGKALVMWEGLVNRIVDTSDNLDFENYEVVVDFEGNRVDMLPIKFLKKGKKESFDDMTDDVATSLMAYAGMATEYDELNNIIGILENAKYMASEREIVQHTGNKTQRESIGFKNDGTIDSEMPAYFRKTYSVKQAITNTQKALDDFFTMHVYGHVRKNEGTLGNTRISKRKTVDTLNTLTSYSQMAINIPQRIANISTGLTNVLIETASHGKVGRLFSANDVMWASGIYMKESGDRLAETGKTDYNNKLSKWCDYFDIHQDNGRTNPGYKKGRVSKIFNSSLLYAGLRMGEDYLALTTSLALAKNFKVKNAEGKIETLWDAYEVKYLDSANKSGAYLAIKSGYTKADGSPITTEDEQKFQKLITTTNQDLQGVYNLDDKSAIHQYSLGALLMMYRKWIAPSIKRRYGKTRYNVRSGGYQEGYYRTLSRLIFGSVKDARDIVSEADSANVISRIVDDLKAYRTSIMLNWSKLTPYEKSNISRAIIELSVVVGLFISCSILGSVPPPEYEDDERGEFLRWWDKQLMSNMLRLRSELGSQAPTPMMVDEAMHILKSPFAAIEPVQNMIKSFNLLLPSNYTTMIKSGRYKGHTKAYKYFRELPIISMFKKVDNFIDPSPLIKYYTSDATF